METAIEAGVARRSVLGMVIEVRNLRMTPRRDYLFDLTLRTGFGCRIEIADCSTVKARGGHSISIRTPAKRTQGGNLRPYLFFDPELHGEIVETAGALIESAGWDVDTYRPVRS